MNELTPVLNHHTQDIDEVTIREEFSPRAPLYAALADEVKFIIDLAIKTSDIRIHDIETRVKTIDSILDKCKRKEITDPFNMMNDIVGCRVICLFRSDLERIDQIFRNEFSIRNVDDKILESTDSFGYMSIHYVATLKDSFSGPRYDKIKNTCFEIQLRTISMHTWAVISHYLEYKGDWDVPRHLRKSLNALSGLFYVADSEFEDFYYESQKSRAATTISTDQDIDLDTVSKMLDEIYPDRPTVDSNIVSDLVLQIKEAGYSKISEIKKDLSKGAEGFKRFEEESLRRNDGRFSKVAVARVTLNIANKKFYDLRRKSAIDDYEKYR